MARLRTLIVGHGGRESAMASRMAADSEIHVFGAHENPTLLALSGSTGGSLRTGEVRDREAVAAFAREARIELAMVSADDPLEAGVVDALLEARIPTVGPTREGAEIEWNKTFARELLTDVAPETAPILHVARSPAEVDSALRAFGSTEVVVKPQGLTGGKGVKVMGPHLADHGEARDYALELLAKGEASVLIEEKITGPEFTIQAVSDGHTVVFPPATYDFPYRYDGDEGPGTGGMGSLSVAADTLPFMTPEHYEQACRIIRAVIEHLGALGRRFTGVMNSGFFATPGGIKVIEFNARFGDPECLNIMSLLQGSWTSVMAAIRDQRLTPAHLPLRREASLVLYLVSPDYALPRGGAPREFHLDQRAMRDAGCEVFFASALQLPGEGHYRTVGTSRAVALVTTAPRLEQARDRLASCAATVQGLEWRRDIGSEDYLDALADLMRRGPAPAP